MLLKLHLYPSFEETLKFTAGHTQAGHHESSRTFDKEYHNYVTIIFWLSQLTLLTVNLFSQAKYHNHAVTQLVFWKWLPMTHGLQPV